MILKSIKLKFRIPVDTLSCLSDILLRQPCFTGPRLFLLQSLVEQRMPFARTVSEMGTAVCFFPFHHSSSLPPCLLPGLGLGELN